MVKIKCILACLGLSWAGFLAAQDFNYAYLVEFTNKANSEYNTQKPLEYLSQRAIDRRTKWGIEITENDFPVNRNYTDSLLTYNAALHVTSRWFNSAVYYTNSNNFIADAEGCSFVKSVKLIYRGSAGKSQQKYNKWQFNYEDEEYGSSLNQIAMCNGQVLHNKGYRGNGIHIAVLDAGFWRANEYEGFDSLFQNNRILSYYDFVTHNTNVFDDNSHGMSVLSTMGAILPNQLIGTAPEASYHLFRTENVASEFPIEEENYIAGAEAADSAGADIIHASLSYSEFDDPEMNYTYADMDGNSTRCTKATAAAFGKGMFVVNGAGNSGAEAWHYITAPSDGVNVLCVGAVDETGTITSFSSRGPAADGRVKPDVLAKGGKTTVIKQNGTVGTASGTSFSGPVMAGMVACLWQALPNYSNSMLLNLIRSYGSQYNNPDSNYGYGIPDFSKSAFVIDSLNFQQTTVNKIVKVYPNPFNESLNMHIFIKHEQDIELTLTNVYGSVVYVYQQHVTSESYNSVTLNGLSGFSVGVYFLTVHTNEGNLVQKAIKF